MFKRRSLIILLGFYYEIMKLFKTISGNISQWVLWIRHCSRELHSSALLKASLNFVRLHWTSDWLTRSMLLGFSDLLATWRPLYCKIASYSGACHFSGVIHRSNALTAKQNNKRQINSTSPPLLKLGTHWETCRRDLSVSVYTLENWPD